MTNFPRIDQAACGKTGEAPKYGRVQLLHLATRDGLRSTCPTCDGTGRLGAGRRLGPDDWERTVACEKCDGSGFVASECTGCLRPVATMIADGIPWCRDCYIEDHLGVELPEARS